MDKLSIACVMILSSPAAQSAELFSGPLPPLPADQVVAIDEVTLAPGAAVPSHRHDAHIYVYVIDGVIDMQLQGDEVVQLSAGQVFMETPDDVHLVMKNPSTTQTARFVSFTIKTAGQSVFTLVDNETR